MIQTMLTVIFSIIFLTARSQPVPAPPAPPIQLPPPQQNINPIFAFYKLTIQRPIALCNANLRRCRPHPPAFPLPNFFTIHGLWPSFPNGQPIIPSYGPCTSGAVTNGPINATYLSAIVNDLNQYWPDLTRRVIRLGSEVFWNEQWLKHGQCSAYPSFPIQYFELTLGLYHLYNPLTILSNNGIVPGQNTTVGDVTQALFNVMNAYVEVRCNFNGYIGTDQLWEISICVDPQNLLTNCTPISIANGSPVFASGTCTSQTDIILFPQ